MEINLTKDSIVNQQTGEVSAPSEYVENLRALELHIQRVDDEIATLNAQLKKAKADREESVKQLRAAVREGKVLPLLEVADEPESDDDDGDGAWDAED